CKWFVYEEGSDEARVLVEAGESLIAPDLVIAESCNVAWKKRRTGQMTREQAELLTGQLAGVFDLLFPSSPFAARALAMAEILAHPVYDCFYLALAEQVGVQVVTADARLLNRLRGTAWQAQAVRLGGVP
ncbi:MAG TPA: type II toxin-antitoxin system VapC family toxin, partial [Geminicoccaceae bacterium]|nr:type II toxin-antitoxin system VapC family toxin [Geminicoccaceae bacterium]